MRPVSALAVPVVLAALLAGCGGTDAPGGSGPSDGPGSTSTSPSLPPVPPADLTQAELVPAAFPLAEIPVLDGKVISADDSRVAINVAAERETAFTDAVARMLAAGYTAERLEEADAEARFTGRGLTVSLLVVADGPANAGVSYSLL